MSKEQEFSKRSIIPLLLQSKEVRVFQYDAKEEELISEEKLDPELVRKYKAGWKYVVALCIAGSVFEFDKRTAAYPFETLSKWMNMTNHVTESLFQRFTSAKPPVFILDKDSAHDYHYTPTVNITQLAQPNVDKSV